MCLTEILIYLQYLLLINLLISLLQFAKKEVSKATD